MITPLAIAFLLGASAVFSQKLTCDEVQGRMLQATKYEAVEVVPIAHSNFNTAMNFDSVPVTPEHPDQRVFVVQPDQRLPILTVWGQSYKLHELKINSLDEPDNGAAFMTVLFSEDGNNTYDTSSVQIFVPLILSENYNDIECNPWITADFQRMCDLSEKEVLRIYQIEWLLPLLENAKRLSTTIVSGRKAFITNCQSVPSIVLQNLIPIPEETTSSS